MTFHTSAHTAMGGRVGGILDQLDCGYFPQEIKDAAHADDFDIVGGHVAFGAVQVSDTAGQWSYTLAKVRPGKGWELLAWSAAKGHRLETLTTRQAETLDAFLLIFLSRSTHMTKEDLDAYVRGLIDELEGYEVTELDDALDIRVAGTADDPIACASVLLMCGGPTLELKKFFGSWTVEGSYGLCEGLSSQAESVLDEYLISSL